MQKVALPVAALLALLAVEPAKAQFRYGSRYQRHSFTLGGGGGLPGREIRPLLDTSPVFRFGYGYRFHPNFQVESGLDTVFHAARIRDFYESRFGDLRIKDYQFMVPVGGRAVIPFASNRLQLSAGGGGAWLRYQERVRQPFGDSGYRIDCPVCRSRSGFGYYGLLGMSVAVDRMQMFRLGFSTRVFRARTSGDAFGPLPAFRTNDSWINTALELSINF